MIEGYSRASMRRSSFAVLFAPVACAAVAVAGIAIAASGCATRARMCGAPNECGLGQGCVAGRCMPDGGVPAIQNAKRILVTPVDVAFVRRGDAPNGGALPPVVALGRAADAEALLLLRFNVAIPKDATVLEAYVMLERTAAVDSDPTPITLHAARIVDPWDGRSISWALQPRIEETRSPSTTVDPAARALVRLDVRDLVNHWRRHEKSDQGIAVLADTTSATGMAFALTVSHESGQMEVAEPQGAANPGFGGVGPSAGAAVSDGHGTGDFHAGAQRSGPRLELYVKEATVVSDAGTDGGEDSGKDGGTESKPDAAVPRKP